jgi:hypothetical protein
MGVDWILRTRDGENNLGSEEASEDICLVRSFIIQLVLTYIYCGKIKKGAMDSSCEKQRLEAKCP